jgi:predicted dehydrogenase
MRPFKILLVGTGSIGIRHLNNLAKLGQKDFVAFRSQRTGSDSHFGDIPVRTHFELENALREKPEIAVIANPTSLHIPVAQAAADQGCHLFLEKPISNDLNGVEQLRSEVEKRRLVAGVGYNLRFHPALQLLREKLREKVVGDVLSVRAWVGQYLPDWHPDEDYRQGYMARTELGGGVILTLSHEIDYLYWLFGEVSDVTAVTARAKNLEMKTESIAEITLRFQNGILGQVHLDCIRRTPQRGCEIVGTEGTICLDLIESELRISLAGSKMPEVLKAPLANSNQPYFDEMMDFLTAVDGSRQPLIPLNEGIAVLQVAVAAHRAAETGAKQECR